MLTAREVAELLGVSTGALLRWTRAGTGPPAVKLPSGAVRYRPGQIDAWLEQHTMADPGGTSVADTPIPRTGPAGRDPNPLRHLPDCD
jgi:predicted DNA-binding transcriptional regulator AlpA